MSPIVLIPARERGGRCAGRSVTVLLRYAHEARTDDGERVFVRGHGVPFECYPPEWLGRLPAACASIGPGLDAHGREAVVLLAQRVGRDEPFDRLRDGCIALGADVVTSDEPVYGLPSQRLSAALPRA